MDVELDDELLLELELELELELKMLSAGGTTTSVGVQTAGMGNSVSLCIAGCPQRPVPKHLTTAIRSSSPTMKYGGAIMGCAACICRAYVHNHLVHDFTGHAVGTFVRGLHVEPLAALLTCSFVYATRQLLWTLPLHVKVVWHNPLHDPQKRQKLDASIPSSPSHQCPNKKYAATCARMPTNCKRCWHPGNKHTTVPCPNTFFNYAILLKIRSGSQQRGTKLEVAAPPLPSWGPKRGRKCYVTRAFLGVPNAKRGEQNQKWSPTKGEKKQKWLPHPCLLGGPKEGGNAASPLHSRGFPTPSAGSKIRSGYLTPAFSGAQKRVERLRHSCILRIPNKGEQNQKWLPHPCLLGGPKRGRKLRGTPAFSWVPNAKHGEEN